MRAGILMEFFNLKESSKTSKINKGRISKPLPSYFAGTFIAYLVY